MLGIVNSEGILIHLNHSWTEVLGYSAEELTSNTFEKFIHPDDLQRTRDAISVFKSGERICFFENRHIHKNGSIVHIHWSLLFNIKKQVAYVSGRDVTEAKRIERHLSQTGALAKVGGIYYDVVKNELTWSPEVYVIREVPFDFKLTVQSTADQYIPEHRPLMKRAVQRALETGEPWDMELQIETPGGTRKWIHTQGRTERVNGRTTAVYGAFQDIDDRKRQEQKLIEQQQRMDFALSASMVGLWEIEIETRQIRSSPQAHALLGLLNGKLEGSYENFRDLIHPDDIPDLQKAFVNTLQNGVPMESEFRCVWPDGTLHWLMSRARKLKRPNGKESLLGTLVSIDERKRMEEERERLRDEFLSIASHELRTPLTPLSLQVKLLQRQLAENPQVTFSLDVLGRQVFRLQNLVEDLLDVSCLSSGRMTYTFEPVNLAEIARETVEHFREQARVAGSEIKLMGAESLMIRADRLRIEEVMGNLVSNSIKYGAGRPIEIELREHDSLGEFRIRDQGIGIRKEDQKKIFGKFQRGAMPRKFGGLGIGLYISSEFVQGHGGTIDCESEPGRGSEFIVRLPKSPPTN